MGAGNVVGPRAASTPTRETSSTPAQRQAYVDAYKHRHQADYDADAKCEAALSQALTDPKLNEAAAESPVVAARALKAAKTLAGTSHSAEVLQWANQAFDPANPASAMYTRALQGMPPLIAPISFDDIVGPAMVGAAGELAAQSGGDAQLAFAKYAHLLGQLRGPLKAAFDAQGGEKLLAALQTALSTGDLSGLEAALSGANGPLAQALGSAGVVLVGLNATSPAQQHDFAALVQKLAKDGKYGAKILATALGTLAKAAGSAASGLATAADFLKKVGKVLGAIVSVAELWKDGGAFFKDPSVGTGLAALGALIATAGNFIPGVGALISKLGMALEGVGELVTGNAEKEQRIRNEKAVLIAAGVDPKVADVLANHPDVTAALSKGGLSPEQIQALARTHPELFESVGYANALIAAGKALGLKGDQILAFADALAKEDPSYCQKLENAAQSLDPSDPGFSAKLRGELEQLFPTAAALGGSSQDSATAQDADNDFAALPRNGPFADRFAELLLQHSSPAYRAELIAQAEKAGLLEQLAGTYNIHDDPTGRAKAFLAALDAAYAEGKISKAEYEYCRQVVTS